MIKFISGKKHNAHSIDDLFCAKNLLNDDTQKVLLPYIYQTKQLINSVINEYDSNGYATIIPSMELGVSYNTGRLAGGFTTGMVVNWQSNRPFVPVDITLKECAGSIAKIQSFDKINDMFSFKRIEGIINELKKAGFKFNFQNGNHFIELFSDPKSKGIYYIVIHSGDDNYRNNLNGVYPSATAWFAKYVRTYWNNGRSRYLNYLVDEPAQAFIDFSLTHFNDIKLFHKMFLEKISNGFAQIKQLNTFSHYGMYNTNTALLGAAIISKKDEFPIFTNRGLPMILALPSSSMWSIRIDNNIDKYIFPHGVGQEILGLKDLKYDPIENNLLINYHNQILIQEVGYDIKLPKSIAVIRDLFKITEWRSLIDESSFSAKWNNNFFAKIEKIIFPFAALNFKDKNVMYF